jgi:predicted nucleic acid-binding protein
LSAQIPLLGYVTVGAALSTRGLPQAEACRVWLSSHLSSGVQVYLPEIVDYELRRELLRAKLTGALARLNALKETLHYLPLTTESMTLAAELWAQARQSGVITADDKAIDGDVILAALALTLDFLKSEFCVATSNAAHLSHFVPAEQWDLILP